MKFSYQWICELVSDLRQFEGPYDLTRFITMKTAECEGLRTGGDGHRY